MLTFPVTHGNPSKTSASNVSSQMISLGTLTNSLVLAYVLSLTLSFYVTYTLQKGRYSKIFIQNIYMKCNLHDHTLHALFIIKGVCVMRICLLA